MASKVERSDANLIFPFGEMAARTMASKVERSDAN